MSAQRENACTTATSHSATAVLLSAATAKQTMRGGRDSNLFQVVPGPVGACAIPIEAERLEALGAVAADLGLDRGELMSLVNLVVYVEGTTDASLLQSTFPEQLRAAGIQIVPLKGAVKASKQGTVDAAWIQLGSWPLAFVVDKVTSEELAGVVNDAVLLAAFLKSNSTERRAVAEIMTAAREVERSITPLGHAAEDIFDLIDDDVLRDFSAERGGRRPWPGHRVARQRAPDNWKEKYLRDYAVDPKDVRAYSELGRRMRELRRIPQPLQELLDDLIATAERGGHDRQ